MNSAIIGSVPVHIQPSLKEKEVVDLTKQVFFKPSDGWSGDYIPFYWDGKFRLFYLLDRHAPNGHLDGIPWCLVETDDFVHFTPQGVMLPYGTEEDQDRCVYTGSVLRAQDKFHIFYTGHNPYLRKKGLPEQKVMHAVSDDLHTWTKIPEHTFQAPAGYECHDWRDPFVFFDDADQLYHMLLAARLDKGAAPRRGCTAHLTSEDLVSWALREPLWAPESYFTHECPDLFKMGDWYYLIFSEFSDVNRTRYVMSRSMYGPWIAPAQDVFDTRPYYAAKSYSDGKKRYLFGWISTRDDETDFSGFRWAGSLAVHELYQLENGELACREPETIAASWQADQRPLAFENTESGLTAARKKDGTAVCYTAEDVPDSYRFEADVSFDEGTHSFGLLLNADPDADTGYALNFEPAAERVEFFIKPRLNYKHFNDEGMNRVFHMNAGRTFHLSIIVDGTIAVAYIDDRIAFSARMYSVKGTRLGIYALHGGVTLHNARISTRQSD